MRHAGSQYAAVLALALAAACGRGPSGPSAVSYAGEWTGATSQGTPIAFTVSSDRKLTKVSLVYNFNGCTGTSAFSADVPIVDVPTAPVPTASAIFDSGRDAPNRTLINFLFTSGTDAHGLVILTDYAGCGAGVTSAAWTAAKR
jgi:hypothetical protein